MSAKQKKSKLLKGATGDWEVVIGLEVHAQVTSKAKLFSGASTEFGGAPNSHVSLVDAAMPGMLPVINEYCVEQAVRTGLGLKAKINLKSVFDRKNYFYPDLPQGYQISQYKSPIVGEGEVVVDMQDGETHRGRHRAAAPGAGRRQVAARPAPDAELRRSQPLRRRADGDRVEAGHALGRRGEGLSSRSCAPSCAISAPATATWRRASLRADVNVSVRKPGEPLGTRCEIKNVNSIRFIGQAIEYEARRQIDILEDGGKIDQETRLFDPDKGETRSMRSKEEAHDYRYFPDPDLLAARARRGVRRRSSRADLPELPDEKKARFVKDLRALRLRRRRAGQRAGDRGLFRGGGQGRDAKLAANWVINELFGRLNKEGKAIADIRRSSAEQLGDASST